MSPPGPKSPTYTLHEDPISGNCYKIHLLCALLGIPLRTKYYSFLRGETRTADFLTRVNAAGRIPVLQIDAAGGPGEDGGGDDDAPAVFLPESNAICCYLAEGTALLPAGTTGGGDDDAEARLARAQVLRWLFWEQYSHEPTVATVRYWRRILGSANLNDAQRVALPGKQAAGDEALRVMEGHLAGRKWFVGDSVTVADIVLFPYTHVAPQSGFDLSPDRYPAIVAWIERVKALEGFIEWEASGSE